MTQRLSARNLFILFVYLFGYVNCYRIGDNPNRRGALLDVRERYHLEWTVDSRSERITFNITVQTRGWILFGLANEDGERTGRDVVIGGVSTNGRAYLSDKHTGRYNDKLETDINQDYSLNSFWESGTHTFLSISRNLDTCDHEDYPITENKVTLVWAYGEQDNENGSSSSSATKDSGSYNIYLLDPEFSPRISRTNLYDNVPRLSGKEAPITKHWTITQTSRVTRNETNYLCSIKKAPSLPKKHHVIGFDVSFANEQSRSLVHHLLLHRCRAPKGAKPRALFESYAVSGEQEICYDLSSPVAGRDMPYYFCTEVYYVWALGGRAYFTPDDVGFPLGEEQDEYYMLQVHYNNPQLLTNVQVSLAMDVFYTQRVRPNEGGVFVFGHVVPGLPLSLLIPPQTKNARIFGHCPGECTQRMFPNDGITIVGAFLHSHTSGSKLRLHHFRGNEELPWILYDDNYSNNFQQIRSLPRKQVQILPGDQVTMDCTYDNTWTNGTVSGGYRTGQEMCLAYVVYYSKTRIEDYTGCASSIVSPEYRKRFLGVSNMTWFESLHDWVATAPSPKYLTGHTLTDISDHLVDWTPELRKELMKVQQTHPHIGRCGRMLSRREPGEIRRAIQAASEVTSEVREMVLQNNYVRSFNTPNDYGGPVAYPTDAIPYTIAEDRCWHKGIFVPRKNYKS